MMTRLKEVLKRGFERPLIGFSVYDYFGAKLVDKFEEVDFVLVGDSLSMVFKGRPDVRHVDMDDMLYHLEIVRHVIKDKPVILDMPLGSYEDPMKAYENVSKAIYRGADGVMIEGIYRSTMEMLSDEDIDFIVHLGYKPKYDEKPRIYRDYNSLLREAILCQELGAEAIKLELVESNVAKMVKEKLDIPVLGVGSGPYLDGHILVLYDFLGMYPDLKARFVRRYIDLFSLAEEALSKLIKDIISGSYPSTNEFY